VEYVLIYSLVNFMNNLRGRQAGSRAEEAIQHYRGCPTVCFPTPRLFPLDAA
jgi:hypothetical protein